VVPSRAVEPERDSRVIEARATRCWVASDGFVRSQIRPGADFVLQDSIDAMMATRELAASLPSPVLVDARGVRTASRESRLYWAGSDARATLSAMAVLVASPVSRVIASFFIRLVRPGFRVRIFDAEADAVAWLRAGAP
jgi:hypothetical protein